MLITEKRKNILCQILCLFTVFIMHELVNIFMYTPWSMGDELGVLATGATFAGMDWSSVFKVMSDTFSEVNYYGGGFGIIFTPLFVLFKTRPFLLYQTILAICAGLQSASAFFSYRILVKYGVKNRIYAFCISIAASFFVTSRATNAMNENMLILCTWLVVYLLTILFDENLKYVTRGVYSVILSFVICYSYTVHSRSLVIAIAIVLVIIIGNGVFNKKIVALIPFFSGMFIFYWAANIFNELIISWVFKVTEATIVYNTGATAATSIIDQFVGLFRDGQWRAFGDIFLTNILGMTIVTAMMILLAFSMWFRLGIKTVNSKVKKREISKENIELVLLGVFIFSSVCLMIGLYSIQGLGNTVLALNEKNCTRSHFYLRYPGAFCGSFVTLLGIFIWKKVCNWKDIIFAILCTALTSAYTLWSIGGSRGENGDPQFDFYHFFSPFCLNTYGEQTNGLDFVTAIIVTVLIGSIITIFIIKQKISFSAILIGIFFVYQYFYLGFNFDVPSSKELHYSIISSVSLFQENDELRDDIEKIYVPLISGRWEISYVLQYYLPETEVIRDMPDNKERNVVLITFSQIWDNEDFEDYEWCQLEDGSYLYVKGDAYIQEFEKYGLHFIPYE